MQFPAVSMAVSGCFGLFQTFHIHLHLNREPKNYLQRSAKDFSAFPSEKCEVKIVFGNHRFAFGATADKFCSLDAFSAARECSEEGVRAEMSGNFPGNLEVKLISWY